MAMNRAKTMLILLLPVFLATPLAAKAWERGKVETFATLPPGEAHPEGTTMDREGNVYVVTAAANKPKMSEGTLVVKSLSFLFLAATVRLDAALLARLVDPSSVGPATE
jgi:hypothetical protein